MELGRASTQVTERMSVENFRAIHGKQKVSKYGNKRVEVDGWKFDSKLEANRYEELKLARRMGFVEWFICQVPFRLPGGIIYRADFLVVWSAKSNIGHCLTVEDCKGADTRVSINKRRQVEAIYGIKVTLIRRHRRA
jgi:Protein of unknown function (DUF1064)